MGKSCQICGTYLTNADIMDFKRFTRKYIAEFVGITVDHVDPKSQITCESCGIEFCKSCFHTKIYNGKNLDYFVQRYGTKHQTTDKRSYVNDRYVCQNCEKEVNLHCHTCGKRLGSDQEFIFSGHHHGFHVKCDKCNSPICLDCATETKNPTKFQKMCPFCNQKKWLYQRNDMLLENYRNNIMFISRSIGQKCSSCHEESSILMICSNKKCRAIYCPECIIKAEKKNLAICPTCGKSGFKEYKKKIPKWKEQSEILKIQEPIAENQINMRDKDKGGKSEKDNKSNDTSPIDESNQNEPDFSLLPDPLKNEPKPENIPHPPKIKPAPLSKLQELTSRTQIIQKKQIKAQKEQKFNLVLQKLPENYVQEIKRFSNVCNSSEDIALFMESENFVIQFNIEGYEGFYLRIAKGRMYNKLGVYPLAKVQSDLLSLPDLNFLLSGQNEDIIGIFHGDEDVISVFLDIYDAFYEQRS